MNRWVTVIGLALLLSVPGCDSSHPETADAPLPPAKSSAQAVRYDTEPLAERIPRLPQPVTGEWVQGILGDELVAGPKTTLWLDAIVEVPHQQLAAYLEPFRSSMVPTSRPLLWKTLNTGVPPPPFERSDELDRMLSTNTTKGGWKVKAFVPSDAAVLVLTATGRDKS